jgi:Telomere recombination
MPVEIEHMHAAATVRTIRVVMSAIRSMVTTQVFPCDPASISFNASSQPLVSCPKTLTSLKATVNDLVSLKTPVVFPTETVYGLAAPALCSPAVSQIFSIKGAPIRRWPPQAPTPPPHPAPPKPTTSSATSPEISALSSTAGPVKSAWRAPSSMG